MQKWNRFIILETPDKTPLNEHCGVLQSCMRGGASPLPFSQSTTDSPVHMC